MFNVKVISEGVRDEVSEVFEVLAKGDDAAVWEDDGLRLLYVIVVYVLT